MSYISEHNYKEKVQDFFEGIPYPEVEDYFLNEVLNYCYRADLKNMDISMPQGMNVSRRFVYGIIHDFSISVFGEDAKLGFKYLADDMKNLYENTSLEDGEELFSDGGGIDSGIEIAIVFNNPIELYKNNYLMIEEINNALDKKVENEETSEKAVSQKEKNKDGENSTVTINLKDTVTAKNKEAMQRVSDNAHKTEVEQGFKKYTDFLAETLTKKNLAYGNSFDEDMEKWGYANIGIRLHDKYGRIEQLIKNEQTTANDESILDSLLDLAGYSILGIKYLIEVDNMKGLKGFNEKD